MQGRGRQWRRLTFGLVNRVAERVHAEVPGVKCEFLAYIHYLTAPTHVKPLPYVVPTFCEHYGSIGARDHFHPITDDRAANKRLREELEKWISVSRQVTEFSYYGDDCIKRFLYRPIPDVIVADYRYYERVKLAGHFVLSTNPEDWWSHAVTLYACAVPVGIAIWTFRRSKRITTNRCSVRPPRP